MTSSWWPFSSGSQPVTDEVVILPTTFDDMSHLDAFLEPFLGHAAKDQEESVVHDHTKFTFRYATYGGRVTFNHFETDAFKFLPYQKPDDPVHIALLVDNGRHSVELIRDYITALRKNFVPDTRATVAIVGVEASNFFSSQEFKDLCASESLPFIAGWGKWFGWNRQGVFNLLRDIAENTDRIPGKFSDSGKRPFQPESPFQRAWFYMTTPRAVIKRHETSVFDDFLSRDQSSWHVRMALAPEVRSD